MSVTFYLVFIVLPLLGSLIAAQHAAASRRHRLATQRLELLQQALAHPQLEPETRRQILAVLADEHDRKSCPPWTRASTWQRLSFAVGWLLFVLFGGLIALGMLGVLPDPQLGFAAPLALAGLALLTLPVGLREWQLRNSAIAHSR